MDALLNRRVDIKEYIVFSTVISLFLQQKVAHVAIDIFLGYPIVIVNALLLLTLGRLYVHRGHAIAIFFIAAFSLLSAHYAETPITAIAAQLLGIAGMSVYYFSVLTTSELTLADWMDLYSRFAFGVAIVGIILFPLQPYLEASGESDRLHSIFVEPSFYIYLTLPAIGWYANVWLGSRRHGWDLLVFIFSYALANSSLGFIGLGLVATFIATSRLGFWKSIGTGVLGLIAFGGLLVASANFRIRAYDTFFAVSSADISRSNLSTFALLSNAYVTFQTFLAHPLLGVGVGGYQYQYIHYIVDLSGIPKEFLDLNENMYDASSMLLRALAELGILGPIAIIIFLFVCSRVRGDFLNIRNALLPYFIIRTARYGAYFSLELFFFVGLYLLNFKEYRMVRFPQSARESHQ